MISNASTEKAYVFYFDDYRKGTLFFRTVSIWAGNFGEHYRDVRKAGLISVKNFEVALKALGQPCRWIQCEENLEVLPKCWLLVPEDDAKHNYAPLLEHKTCLKSPLGLFWDIDIPRGRAGNRRIPKKIREVVLERDGHKCVECSKKEANGVTLTMDHVIPFSRGGESTAANLVTLCSECNQKYGNEHHPHLFALAGLHSGYDPTLLQGTYTSKAISHAINYSDNIIVAQCRNFCSERLK